MSIRAYSGAVLFACLVAGCSSAPFGYAENRCTGQQNACQADCASLDDGPARSACIQRCYSVEDRCTTSGYDGTGSSLAVDQGVGAAKSRREKEADYEEWRAKRQRERIESGEGDVDIEVVD
ncbi:hypothetical protein [Hyphococcus sp.]|jgi:hypothetical protein|uniref:hypothetical protein n=1 Tax=Hyphococcus sp. TaxID=2038636 RepID=UPI003D1009DD